MKRKFRIPIMLVMFCFLTMPFKSCVDSDDYDFDKLSEKVDWQPDFIAPLGYGEYSLWYLLNQHEAADEDQTIVLGDDGLIHIKYTEKDIFNYEASEVLDFPDQKLNPLSFSMSSYPSGSLPFPSDQNLVSKTVNFDIKADEADIILTQLKLDTKINFTVSNPVDKAISLNVTLEEGSLDGTNSAFKSFEVLANANNQKLEWDLSDLVFTFKTPSISNTLNITFEVTILADASGTIVSNGNSLDITYQLANIDFKLAKGDFGAQTIDIGSGDIDMDVDFWDDIDGNFTFSDPQINIIINNKVGVPFKLDANMTASNSDGLVESLDPNPTKPEVIIPDYPKTEADVLAGIDVLIPYNKGNSNIVALMALPPSGNIAYSGFVHINENLDGTRYNPLAAGNNINIISGASSISADLEMDIPLDFKADNLSISDTINDVDIDDADKILEAKLIITSENGLPLDVKIDKIYFTDINYAKLDSLCDVSIIKAAGVNGTTGEVDPSTITEVISEIVLTEKQILSLNDTENIIIKAGVNTYDEGKVSVKLKGTDILEFSVALSAKVDLSK